MRTWRSEWRGDIDWAAMRIAVDRAVGPDQDAVSKMIGEVYHEAWQRVGTPEEYKKKYGGTAKRKLRYLHVKLQLAAIDRRYKRASSR